MRFAPVLAAVLAAASLPAAAQALKPGLWEITNKVGGNAQIDQAMAQMQKELANMPPEQRRQMEAMMAQRGMQMPGAAGKGMAVKVCMTKEQTEKNDMPMQEGCAITKNQRSGNVTNVAFTCSNPPSSGEGQYTHMGPEAFASKMTVRTLVQGKPETMTSEGSGKWLAGDCGAIRPMQMPKK